MNWQKCTLRKQVSDDGHCEMHDGIPIGTEYEIDLDSIIEQEFVHVVTRQRHTKLIGLVRGGVTGTTGYMPLELLAIQES